MQEFFQGLECHMILTQTFYSKVSGLVAQRENQALEETMALAHSVLKQAHRRGVELEGILEVRIRMNHSRKLLLFVQFQVKQSIYCNIITAYSPLSLAGMEQAHGRLSGSL